MSESTKKKFYQTDGFRMFMGKYGIGVILIFMILVIGVMKPRFLYPSNILNVLTQISVNCLIAYGMCLCITTGGIDLSGICITGTVYRSSRHEHRTFRSACSTCSYCVWICKWFSGCKI